MSDRSDSRTLLEWLIQESDRTVEEHCADFERRAGELGELGERGATLSVRQLGRWMAGEVDTARPASRRVAKELWGYGFRDLLDSPAVGMHHARAVVVATVDDSPFQAGVISHAIRGHALSLQEEIAMAADEAARFARRAGVSVSAELIEQFDSDVRGLASEYLRRPPYATFRPLAALRSEVFGSLDRHPRPEFIGDLYRIAGRISALIAHASSDLGNPYAADSHARTAWLCADLAEDRRLGTHIRWVQSNIAYWRGDYSAAVEIARAGQRLSSHPDDELRLRSQEARACAAMRDERESNRALAATADMRAKVGSEPNASAAVFDFGAGKAAYYSSEATLALGGAANVRAAVRDAAESIQLLVSSTTQESSAELLAAARLDLVSALLAKNDLDAAEEHIGPALTLPTASRTVPVVVRISGIHGMLGRSFAGIARADEIREQIDLFSAYPATVNYLR